MNSFFCGKGGGGDPLSYAILEKEDPEERRSRKAQFLIYKTLEAADRSSPRRSPCVALKLCRRVKLRAGRRLERLRKAVHRTFFSVRRRLRRMLCPPKSSSASLPPLLVLGRPCVRSSSSRPQNLHIIKA